MPRRNPDLKKCPYAADWLSRHPDARKNLDRLIKIMRRSYAGDNEGYINLNGPMVQYRFAPVEKDPLIFHAHIFARRQHSIVRFYLCRRIKRREVKILTGSGGAARPVLDFKIANNDSLNELEEFLSTTLTFSGMHKAAKNGDKPVNLGQQEFYRLNERNVFYSIVNSQALKKRAENIGDPRHVYYKAMLECSTLSAYLERTHDLGPVYPVTYNNGKEAISALREFRYAFDNRKWIVELQVPINDRARESDLRADFEREFFKARKMSSADRRALLAIAPKKPELVAITTTGFRRSGYVVAEVLERAAGNCEGCKKPAPFKRRTDDTPYLEVHHRVPLADGGDDTVENAVALCPNCHRRMHFGSY